jgi:hypothetical protein
MPDFLRFVGNLPVVAHNADFDMGFLAEKLPRINHKMPVNRIWDSLKLGVLLYPELDSYGLEALAKIFDIPFRKSHRASEDCIVTGKLFVTFLKNAPAILSRELLEKIAYTYIDDDSLSDPLKCILRHPDYDRYAQQKVELSIDDDSKNDLKGVFRKKIKNPDADILIRISTQHEISPRRVFLDKNLFPSGIRHYFVFPSTQYPGDFWGVSKKWNEVFDFGDKLVLYPGMERLLCRRQMQIFIEDDKHNHLNLSGFEIAVLTSFASVSKIGNFSSLSWWIWNNLKNLATAIPFLNSSNCHSADCPHVENCYYLNAYERARTADRIGLPYRVIREEPELPGETDTTHEADLTFLQPEGIFRDNLGACIKAYALTHDTVLMRKIIKSLSPNDAILPSKKLDEASNAVETINNQVDAIIRSAGKSRLQKGKRFFLFIEEDLFDECLPLLKEFGKLNEICMEFLNSLPEQPPESALIISRMLERSSTELDNAITSLENDNMVLCLDKIENGTPDMCRFLFFPHIFHEEFLKIPTDVSRIFNISHHIIETEDWHKYVRLLGRDRQKIEYHDISKKIPDGNQIHLAPPASDGEKTSKKRLMEMKGDVLTQILSRYPGRTIVIVRGSQELLNFKYRLSPKLKEAGYWPLFQKQDGPKGLLIKEFSKHKNVVFFGLTDLVEDIWQFDKPPDNLVFESLHLTSLQDPIESFIKKEIEDTGEDYTSEYLEPRIHFTLTRSLNRWQNYLEGRGQIFILDENLSSSDAGLMFIKQLSGEKLEL